MNMMIGSTDSGDCRYVVVRLTQKIVEATQVQI